MDAAKEKYNISAERQFLGWMIVNEQFIDIIEDLFFNRKHRELYKALRSQYYSSGNISGYTLEEHALTVAECVETPFPIEYSTLLEAIERDYRYRKYLAILTSKAREAEYGERDIDELISETREELSRVAAEGEKEEYDHQKSVYEWVTGVDEARTAKEEDGSLKRFSGYECGINNLDLALNGFQPGLSYVIGGLKKTGKSRMAMFLASRFLQQGLGGIAFSMEMKINKIHNCIVAERTEVNTAIFKTPKVSPAQMIKISSEAISRYMMQSFYISVRSGINPNYVRSIIQKRKIKNRVDFVIVDYIQRMRVRAESRAKEVERCALDLADIARDENVVMIILSQLSNEAEKMSFGSNKDKDTGKSKQKPMAPIYAFFKESGAIIESCDVTIALIDPNRGEPFDPASTSKDIEAIILQRDGLSDIRVNLNAQLQYSRFSEREAF